MAWTKLPNLPGFALIEDDGTARAYLNCAAGPDVVAAWKVRYPDHVDDIDQGLAACFPDEEEEETQ